MKRAKRPLLATAPPLPKVRNPIARSPLLAKGGAHGKTVGARRRHAKVELARLQRDPTTAE